MESFSGCGFSVGGCFVRKKRSVVLHKPRLDPLTFSERSKILLPVVNSFGKESLSKKRDSKDKVLYSDGLQSEKRPKKLKLKLRGVTHTIQSKYAADSIVCGDSPIPTSSSPSDDFTPQLKPLQDVKTFCSSDGGKGVGVKRKYSLKFSSSSRKEYSSKGQISGESVPEDGEPARKSKRIQKRRVSDVGLSEDGNEDNEIQFLERLNASKVAAPKRGKMDGDHGGDIENSKLPRLRKHSGKKSRSEKMCEDRDYLGEEDDEELISDDELESNGKTLKRGSLSLLLEEPQKSTPTTRNRALQSGVDILNGSGSNDINLATHFLPASSRKKEKISEVDKQSKKAEAAQRRKIQTEKIAREAEAEAIRKILGQDSKKKKREDELKQKRDELSQGRKTSAVTLAPNTVRWVNGPNGTVVTFSDDIGLPNIFSPALCSLHCYRALNGKTERLIAC
ncbi:uncharacterized protein LOC126790373 isoform X2 [Argentina anserina]|uniref:uncharacterized protein LOC126790373 isoform X2 n=1 Tax=Argentina anserina TaxID=57926 RepID=UPI0021769034|nr:uncharacterized protein LOC126790373 isoform X2 [Potentilla anserina]